MAVVGDLLDNYAPADTFDEMFTPTAEARAPYEGLVAHLGTLSRADLDERSAQRDPRVSGPGHHVRARR